MTLALQLIGSFGIFLVLLAAGMAIPFAITVPAVIYLLMQNGMIALKGIGLVTWGSMDSFTLTAIPLFVLMAELMQRSGLSSASTGAWPRSCRGCPADCSRRTSSAARCLPRSAA